MRHTAPDGTESTAAYGSDGEPLPPPAVPFARSLAASVVSFQEPVVLNDFDPKSLGPVELLPFEANRSCILAAPLRVGSETVVVIELFDKAAPGFTDDDRRLVAAAAEVGADLLRQALAERQTHRLLFDAVEAALQATANLGDAIRPRRTTRRRPAVMAAAPRGARQRRRTRSPTPDTTLRLVEAVRALALRHGPTRGRPLCAGGERPAQAARRDHRSVRGFTTKAQRHRDRARQRRDEFELYLSCLV